MCDKASFDKLRDRVSALERRDDVQDEQIKTLFKAQRIQFWTIWGAFMLCLLALIFGALGPRGFNAVTNATPNVMAEVAGGEQ